ncbi:MAG: aminotransferase class V-fold PLP-dependent enzyme [Candidatus Thorarchaeota archaeon]
MTEELNVKTDFDIFTLNPDLAYFDSASTTLVPQVAVEATCDFLRTTVASSRRGAHRLATSGSAKVEDVRSVLAQHLGVEKSELSFQKSIPSAVASLVYGHDWKGRGQNKIVIAQSEEHSVMVALLRAAKVLNLTVEIVPVDSEGTLQLEVLERAVDDKTGITAVGTCTVGMGTKNPIKRIADIVHANESLLLTDASRSIDTVDGFLSQLDADIVILSANTTFMAPPGLAIQWIKKSLGLDIIPGILGGSSVANVEAPLFEVSLTPDKFESGTLNVPSIIGLGAAVNYLEEIGPDKIRQHLTNLSAHLLNRLREVDYLKLFGTPTNHNTIFGFNLGDDTLSCHDVALFLDQFNIAIRSGLLCAHPLIRPVAPEGMLQISLHIYNSLDDCNRLVDSLHTISNEMV